VGGTGTYLVVGDLERGLGSHWARALARGGKRRLVLVSAAVSAVPVAESLLSACRAEGAKVDVHQVDLGADGGPVALAALLDPIAAQGLAGVFVSLPTTDAASAAPLSLVRPAHWRHNQQARLDLLDTVAEALARHATPWCCVQSSLSAALGGIGLAP